MFRPSKIKCYIKSDDAFVERGIVSVLASAGYEICSSIISGDGDVCEIFILCAGLQGNASYVDLCTTLPRQCRLVVLARYHDTDTLPPQALACAAAVLDCGVSQQKLLVTLDAVMMGAVVRDIPFFRPSWGAHDIRLPAPSSRLPVRLPQASIGCGALASPFSTREQEILSALAEGVSNKHIARRFAIAESTVKVHVKHILRKLNMNNRTQAAIWARRCIQLPA